MTVGDVRELLAQHAQVRGAVDRVVRRAGRDPPARRRPHRRAAPRPRRSAASCSWTPCSPRRSVSLRPPQMPCISPTRTAWSRHSRAHRALRGRSTWPGVRGRRGLRAAHSWWAGRTARSRDRGRPHGCASCRACGRSRTLSPFGRSREGATYNGAARTDKRGLGRSFGVSRAARQRVATPSQGGQSDVSACSSAGPAPGRAGGCGPAPGSPGRRPRAARPRAPGPPPSTTRTGSPAAIGVARLVRARHRAPRMSTTPSGSTATSAVPSSPDHALAADRGRGEPRPDHRGHATEHEQHEAAPSPRAAPTTWAATATAPP